MRARSIGWALFYFEGRGTERDPKRAADWVGKAAEQGDTQAQYPLWAFPAR